MATLRTRLEDHRADLAALASLVVLGTAFLFEMVAMDAVPVARDIQLFFIPHKQILWEALQNGKIPLWTPLIRTGYPVLANFQSGVFYPPHWLYAAGLPFLTAFNLILVLHVLLGGVGAYVLARRLEFGPAASWVGAVCYMLGGYFVSLTNLVNALQVAAWAPAMVAALIHHVEGWRPATLAGMVAVYLMGFLAGEPQTFLLVSGVALAFGLVWSGSGSAGPGAWRRVLGAIGATAAAVAGLAALQILPTLEMVGRAGRGAGLTLSEAGRYSLEPVRLIHLLVPNDFSDPVYRFGRKMQFSAEEPWLYSIYVGLSALVLAWHARWDRGRRRQVLFWVVLAVAGVVLALGRHLPFFPWLHSHVPGFAAFRFPEKFFVLTGLAVPILAAHGTAGLLERPEPDAADASAALGALAGALAVLVGWTASRSRVHGWLQDVIPGVPVVEHFGFAWGQWRINLEIAVVVLAATVAVAWLYRKRHLGRSLLLGVICVVVPLDFWLAHRAMTPVVDQSFYTRPPAVHEALPVDELTRRFRYRATPFREDLGKLYTYPGLPTEAAKWLWQQTMAPASGVLWDVQAHDAMDAIHLTSVRATDELLRELPPERRRRLLRLASVKYLYHPLPAANLPEAKVTEIGTVPGYVYELEGAVPRAYLAHGRQFDERIDALNFILAPSADLLREVAVVDSAPGTDEGRPASEDGGGSSPDRDGAAADKVATESGTSADAAGRPPDPGSARIVSEEGGEIGVRVSPDTASYLVLTDTRYPGWTARVDGEERPLRTANYFFKAVRVRPGDERVVFRYRSQPLRTGAWISGASLVVLLLGLGGWSVRRRGGVPGSASGGGNGESARE